MVGRDHPNAAYLLGLTCDEASVAFHCAKDIRARRTELRVSYALERKLDVDSGNLSPVREACALTQEKVPLLLFGVVMPFAREAGYKPVSAVSPKQT
ncbi:MAG: hypothetical protein DDT39_01519 [Firmicutes bacterium]|nr:hypothetical protein [candidate division NPL-UPA2 bacterium]